MTGEQKENVRQMRRAVIRNPDDVTPRLLYADALEETGDSEMIARAEFIRLCPRYRHYRHVAGRWHFSRLANSVAEIDSDSEEVRRLILEVRDGDSKQARLVARQFQRSEWTGYEVENGMVVRVDAPLFWLLLYGPSFAKRQPLCSVRVTDKAPSYRPADNDYCWYACLEEPCAQTYHLPAKYFAGIAPFKGDGSRIAVWSRESEATAWLNQAVLQHIRKKAFRENWERDLDARELRDEEK